MTIFLLRRLGIAAFTLFAVSMLVYGLIRSLPGDPTLLETEASPRKVDPEDFARMRETFGLNEPLYLAYFKWLGNIFAGDWGTSFSYKRGVLALIGEHIGPTLTLSGISLFLSYLLSIPLGLYCSRKEGRPIERVTSLFLYMLYSLPAFVAALMLQSVFSVQLQGTMFGLPLSGITDADYAKLSTWGQIVDRFRHLILPVFCYTYASLAYETRFIRANMAEVVRQDYVRTARAKGVDERMVYFKHAFRNTLIPLVTMIGLTLPTLLSGSVILEQIFDWRGIGKLLYDSISARDYPLTMGLVFIYAILTLAGQLLADVLYAVVDPRITYV